MSKRTADFCEFLTIHLPPPPARVLEIGCGAGELARALAARGFDVVAIDPDAPDGEIFQRIALEDFSDSHPFDAVVASVSLHHVHDLAAAVDKIAAFLPKGGVLALEEFAKERLVGATARWYHGERLALAAAGREDDVLENFDEWARHSEENLADIHPVSDICVELDRLFVERLLAWTPYLYSHRLDDALEPLERKLIDEGAIIATGLRYVGERR